MSELYSFGGDEGNYGYRPRDRPIDLYLRYGLIPIDKPAGPTSHEVVAWVRKMLGLKKAGHSGTLDPPATGMLPIGLGEATKALSLLLSGPKEYVAVARLHSSVNEEKLMRVIEEFRGEIYQRPPQRSSVKRVTRIRRIHELELLEKKGNLLLFRVLCQSGTYIRKLIYDMGEVLCVGATMVELRRTRVGPLGEDRMVRLHELYYAVHRWKEGDESMLRRLVLPVEEVIELKPVYVRDSAVNAICHGAQLAVPGIAKLDSTIKKGELVALYTLKGELVALAEALYDSNEIVGMEKGIAFRTKRVIMEADLYPRMWRTKTSGRSL